MILRFRRTGDGAVPPTRAHDGDAGYDLYAAEDASIEPGARVSVATGIALEIPERHAGLVVPRSGLAARHGLSLVNSPGLIDASYRGEVRILLLNTDGEHAFEVRHGDRIAQLVILRVEVPDLVEVDALQETVRGASGFGSTGR
jgi:dUTP pyrophosphatase